MFDDDSELEDARLEQLDVEGLLGFAEYVLTKRVASVDGNRRWNNGPDFSACFSEGLRLKDGKIGTVVTCLAFTQLEANEPNALPETRVTFHSGDMGDTLPCKGKVFMPWKEMSCRGRPSPVCGSGAGWRDMAPLCQDSGSPVRPATRFSIGYKDCGSPGADRLQPRRNRHANQLPSVARKSDHRPEAGVSELGRAQDSGSGYGDAVRSSTVRRSARSALSSTATGS